MQPSPVEIQREVEALRDIRRRSSSQGGPGTLILDPDLPIEPSPSSSSTGYWTSGTNPGLTDGDSSSSSHDDGSSSEPSNADDPFHLFWVPARLHPEIAPTEFRAFLKEHARNPHADGGGELSRSTSAVSASSLGRRASMLSRQYRPNDSDASDDEQVLPLRRNRSSIYNRGPQLTINDLQKLDQLAEEASESDDPTKLRSILRRSLSLNVAPSGKSYYTVLHIGPDVPSAAAMDMMDNMPDMGEDADAPIIVPRPGQILRRAARTKIRKPGLPGDGGGHRFGQSTRRQTTGSARNAPTVDRRTSSDRSSSDHSEPLEPSVRGRVFSGEGLADGLTQSPPQRPDSYSDEASLIFDAYVREDIDEDESRTVVPSPVQVNSRPSRVVVTSAPSAPSIEVPLSQPLQPKAEPIPMPVPLPSPVIHQPQPQRVATLRPPTQEPIRTVSPDALRTSEGPVIGRSHSPGSEVASFLSTSPNFRKEKDKKGLFGFGRDKSSKKAGKEKEREKEQREKIEREREEEKKKEKEKESGFFGSFFGGKKKQDDSGGQSGSGSGREHAAAPGASRYVPPISPQFMGADGSYARYPIHVERAIYRLSHIKLANPRRPLYEQVLISNLMFWYLGVINKTQSPGSSGPTASGQTQHPQGNSSAADKEAGEREQQETEERQRAEKEKEHVEKEKEREREQQQRKEATPRRGSLTKNTSAGPPAGRRAAEMPVKGPQYEMQHRVMEQEYGSHGSGSSPPMPVRTNTIPVSIGGGPPRPAGQPQGPDAYHSLGGNQQQPPQIQLPPGAMAPMSSEQMSWLSSPPPSPKQSHRPSSPPSPPPRAPAAPAVSEAYPAARRSRSPPQHNQNRFAPSPIHMPDLYIPPTPPVPANNPPSRSRSATASATPTQPPAHPNGKLRKNTSAQAVMANGRKPRRSDPAPTSSTGEEEDVPLAVWQQQRRR